MGNFGWIEIVLFYGLAIGFGAWQWIAMDRKLSPSPKALRWCCGARTT